MYACVHSSKNDQNKTALYQNKDVIHSSKTIPRRKSRLKSGIPYKAVKTGFPAAYAILTQH